MATKKKTETAEMESVTVMSVFDALQRVKTIKKKINDIAVGELSDDSAVMFNFGTIAVLDGKRTMAKTTKEQQEAAAKARWQKINDLFQRLRVIEELIHESNSKTPITIAGITYKNVATAMARANMIRLEMGIYNQILASYRTLKKKVDDLNEKNNSLDAFYKKYNIQDSASFNKENLDALKETFDKETLTLLEDYAGLMVGGEEAPLIKRIRTINDFIEDYHNAMNRSNLSTFITVPNDIVDDYTVMKPSV